MLFPRPKFLALKLLLKLPSAWFGRLFRRLITDFDIQAERLHFFHQHVEGFRHAGLQAVVTLDDAS